MNRKVKQLHEIVDSPNYEGKYIHLRPNDWAEFAVNSLTYEEDKSCDTEAITVILGSVLLRMPYTVSTATRIESARAFG